MNDAVILLGLNRPGRALAFAFLLAGAFVGCVLLFAPLKALCGCIFLFGMIAGCCVDFDQMILPDMFTVGLAVAGVGLSLFVPDLHGLGHLTLWNSLRSGAAALLGVGLGSALGLWIGVLGEVALDREVFGFGDVKFLGAIGAFCGWRGAVFALFGGAVVAVIVLPVCSMFRRSSVPANGERNGSSSSENSWHRPFPFGPMLAVAAALYFFALHVWADPYLSRYVIFF